MIAQTQAFYMKNQPWRELTKITINISKQKWINSAKTIRNKKFQSKTTSLCIVTKCLFLTLITSFMLLHFNNKKFQWKNKTVQEIIFQNGKKMRFKIFLSSYNRGHKRFWSIHIKTLQLITHNLFKHYFIITV